MHVITTRWVEREIIGHASRMHVLFLTKNEDEDDDHFWHLSQTMKPD